MKIRLQQIEVADPESIAVFIENKECSIVLTGEKATAKALAAKINNIIDDIENSFEKESQLITKTRKLKHYEMALVRAARLETTLKKMLTDFKIDNEQREVICKVTYQNIYTELFLPAPIIQNTQI